MKTRAYSIRLILLLLVISLLVTGLPIYVAADGSNGAAVIRLESTSGEKKNLFMGMFDHYVPDQAYISSIRRMWPDDYERYSDGFIQIHLNQLLTLYLANLEDEGYHFGVIEREDLCSESTYVVELTEQGKSVIQVHFQISPVDPKYPWIIILGCDTNDFSDMEILNRYVSAMWIAYETLNIHMNDEKYDGLLMNSEYTNSDEYGVVFRGQYDGLGYCQLFGSEVYLVMSPDLSIPVFQGLSES